MNALQVAHYLGPPEYAERETAVYKQQNEKFTLCYEAQNRRLRFDTCSSGGLVAASAARRACTANMRRQAALARWGRPGASPGAHSHPVAARTPLAPGLGAQDLGGQDLGEVGQRAGGNLQLSPKKAVWRPNSHPRPGGPLSPH